MKLFRKVVVTATTALIVATLSPSITATAGSADSTCYKFLRSERGFARRINGARSDFGLGKLHLDPELSKAAKVHTRDMAKSAQLYHTPSNTLSRRVTGWTVLGENVGVGGGVPSLHDAFMASTAHRDNILYPSFRHVGVGVVRKDGRMWVTVIFEAVNNPGTTLKMPSC